MRQLFRHISAESEDQLQFLARLNLRETQPRSLAFAAISIIFFIAGHQLAALILAAAYASFDICRWYLTQHIIKHPGGIRRIDLYAYMGLETTLRLLFVSYGFYAVTADNISVILTGGIWIFGNLFIIAVNYGKIPLFYPANLAPIAAAIFVFEFSVGWHDLRRPTAFEWLMPMLATLVLSKAVFRLLAKQNDTIVLLEKAEAEAEESLSKLKFIADHDDLTGLLNRASFTGRLERLLESRTIDPSPFGFILFDLDGFKPINDSFGHPAGDAVLREVSARLKNEIGAGGFVARVGGDEFAATLPKHIDADMLEDLAHDLIRLIQLPIRFQENDLGVGVSLGGVICSTDLDTPEKIMAAADAALYRAKENPKSTYFPYSKDLDKDRVSIEERTEIETAIRDRVIRPFYQPKFRLDNMQIVGFEALARWPHQPEKPSDTAHFIDRIEKLGLLGDFTYQMARQVFADVRDLLEAGYNPGNVSLNVPEATLATISGMEDFHWLMAEYKDVVRHITFEITEDVFITRAGSLILENIGALRSLGVRISLDDFGTGFASFQHLRQLPFDELKIDTAFVAGLGKDPTADVIVDGFISIARGLEVSVVAEGVETEAQRQHLRKLGCKTAQGFLFSRAVKIDAVKEMLTPIASTKLGMQN